ncbi:MAG: tetratricopeptide repeat protein [Polyangiaceae bacterium]
MFSETIRTALGHLQDDPDNSTAWEALASALAADDRDLDVDDLLRLLGAARSSHGERGEARAAARLLEFETEVAKGSEAEADLLRERARVLREELLDDETARQVLERLLEVVPGDTRASEIIEESDSKREKWKDLVATYAGEAEQAPDDVYKSSMLMRAAEMELRFGAEASDEQSVVEKLEQAVRLDPTNVRAGRMLELVYRRAERWDDVAPVLERLSDRAETATDRVACGIRLARLYRSRSSDEARAARAYERVLKDRADHGEAKAYLSQYYEREQRWDDLVALYERDLKAKDLSAVERLGDMLQIAMLYWKRASRPKEAESWFERIAKLEPTHPGMLSFYREYAAELGQEGRLIEILQNAQRAMKDGPEKTELSSEIARLMEGQADAQKAIEQYKGVLRQDPDNVEARDALKRLYKQTQGYNALVELLRQQLERIDASEYATRLAILREVASVYRQYIKSDTALVTVLNQIVQLDEKLDEHDVAEVRELVGLYEKLGRWRDLLTNQLRLAEITGDVEEKKELFRDAARRWLDQFSNVQNATEAYEALLKVDRGDREARERLHELYRKRRAWPALYELYESELEDTEESQQVLVLKEMAQLAAERLGKAAEAVQLYRRILQIDPSRMEVLDSLERHAERSKDFNTLADVLERRVDAAADEEARLAALTRLGGVYADQLKDPANATKTWQRVLELSPGHHRALRVLRESYLETGDYDGLEALYASQSDWEGLADVLSNAADRAKDDSAKIELSYRAAAVYEGKLEEPERAFRSYERILATSPTDVRAAKSLIPLYEADEKWARLPALYELLASAAEGDEQVDIYCKIIEITAGRLSDRKAAAAYAERVYGLAPQREDVLKLFEDTARAAGALVPFVGALESRLVQLGSASASDTEEAAPPSKRKKGKKKGAQADAPAASGDLPERRRLELMLARAYQDDLDRTDDAVGVYKRLLERDASDVDAAEALEQLLRKHDRRDDLRWLLDLRVRSADDSRKAELLSEWATLEEDVYQEPARAIELHKRVLEITPERVDSLRTLARLLLDAGDVESAVDVIEKHRDQLDGEERALREVDLAEINLTRLGRALPAQEAAIRALEASPGQPRAIAVLEKLMEDETTRARAAEVLAAQYATGGEARREVQALGVMLDQAADEEHRRSLFIRLADVHEEKLGAYGNALDVMLRAVRAFPTAMDFWDRAESLAVLAGRPTDLSEAFREVLRTELTPEEQTELCERAARLHEDRLGDPIGATPYLERILDHDPGNEQAFLRLKDILTAAERWGELEALYDKAASATDDTTRRVDMFVEVALIAEEIIENSEKATRYYERIIELDPMHDVAVRALDRLYAKAERHQDLAGLLERRLDAASGDELLELKLRLSRLLLEKLHQPDKAVGHVEDVLTERPNDYDARELAERLLEIGNLRLRAARMLETVYEARDEVRDLVRVLAVRLEEQDKSAAGEGELDDERRDLLRRIALLRDERLHDDDAALGALARLVPADPLDLDSRERLLEIGRRIGAHSRVAEVLALAAKRADTPGLKGEILMKVAEIYEELLNDADSAEKTYREVLTLDESDAELVLPAARALERIYVGSDKSEALGEVLRIQVKLEAEGEARKALLGRLGELCQSVLGDAPGAIEAWRMRAEENPGDELALAALDRLYEENSQWRELVDVLSLRRDATEDLGMRRKLMVRAATTLSSKLDAIPDSIDAWRAVLDEYGPDAEVLLALEGLFERAEQWHDLAETYERHLDLVEADADRLELLAKLGRLKQRHLGDTEGALETYRRALTLDSGHEASRGALEDLLESDDGFARREAAGILHPIYEADGAHEKLLRVIDIEIDGAEDVFEKLKSLEKAIQVAEVSLQDDNRAYQYAERAVRSAAGHTELAPWLAHIERLADRASRQADYVKLLCQVVDEIFDGEVQLSVTLKIAEIARHQLADRELAREYYRKALELRSDDKDALAALESLYEEMGDAPQLLEVLERRAEVVDSDEERKALLFRRARLLSDVLRDNARSIQVYESVLDSGMDRGALDALESLYTLEERWPDLQELYARQLDAADGAQPGLRVKVAQVAAHRLNDMGRAFEELELALDEEKQHEGAIAELEKLLAKAPEAEHRSRAAAILEPVYLQRADFDKVMGAIEARLEFEQDPVERRELLGRLAQLHEEQKEDYRAALETTAKLLHEDLSDESTRSELERLAKVAGAERRLAEIYAAELEEYPGDDDTSFALSRRAGELFTSLEDLERGLVFYRRALAFEPESHELFEAVDDILAKTGRHEERVAHYRQGLDHRFEPRERLAAYHTIAQLLEENLGRKEEAIEAYRSALETDETDETAAQRLTELYRSEGRNEDLAELLLRRAELAPSADQAAGHRVVLAQLLAGPMQDKDRAIDQLDEVVRSLPGHSEAVRALEAFLEDEAHKERVVEILRPLYEGADDWQRLIRLNEDRYALAEDTAEKVLVLRETAELWERRGGDLPRAEKALTIAFGLDPDDGELRTELERVVESTGQWDRLAKTYQAALDAHPDMISRRDVLARLAEVHDRRRDDPRAALDSLAQLRAVDETDAEPLAKMEQLATLLSDWTVLIDVLRARAEYSLDDEERASLWRRIGEAKRDMLEDAAGAIAAYERAMELEPDSAFTVDCLIQLREDRGDAEELVELYQRRVELTDEDDADMRYELLTLAAKVYEEKLEDRGRAIDALNQALSARPDDDAVIAGLGRLYRAEAMWPELLDNLRLSASRSAEPTARAELRRQMGAILAEQMSAWEDALEAYRQVLDDAPGDEGAIEAVLVIGREHEDLRETVTEVLVPVLTAAERWKALAEVLEMRLSVETDPSVRAETLTRIAHVHEERLGAPEQALGAALRALSERPESTELHDLAERLAAASGTWSTYADALAERAQSTFDPDVGRDLYSRLGRVAEERLSDPSRAIDAYRSAVEQAGDQPELLSALDRLYAATNDPQALADVLERRVLAEADESAQATLHYRLGVVQATEFQEPGRALSSFRSALERVPQHEGAISELEKLTAQRDLFEEAAEILEGVYRSQGQTDRLASLYEKRVGFADTSGERIDMRKNLARVLEDDCSDPAAAQRVLQQGLKDDPADQALLDDIERLAQITGNWEGAAAALRDAIEEAEDLSNEVARDLCVRLSTWQRDKIEDHKAAEEALIKALTFDAQSDDVLVLVEQLRRVPGRERDLVATLRQRAKLALDEQRREEFFREAKALADQLEDAELAESVLRELLGQDDTNLWALGELTEARERAGDWQETFDIILRRAELRAQGDVVRELRHRAATIAREHLKQPEQAIGIYEQLFEDEPTDEAASSALRQLYFEQERWDDLARLLERLTDLADSDAQRATLRVETARLNVERFEAIDSAIDILRGVLEDNPGHEDAVVLLSELLEKTGRDEDLADLLTSQIELAASSGNQEAELSFRVRLGEVAETRLNDKAKAIATYQAVLERSATHSGALEALARLYAAEARHADAAEMLDRLVDQASGDDALGLVLRAADAREAAKDAAGVAAALERGLGLEGSAELKQQIRDRLRAHYESEKVWDKLASFVAEDAEMADSPEQKVQLLRRAAAIHLGERKDPAEAATLLERASALAPDDRELMLELCDAFSASGRGKAAAEVLEKIVESYGGKRSKELGEIHRRLADAYLADGDTERALVELDKAFRIEPGNVAVLHKLGSVALQAGDMKKAQQMYRALLLQKLDDHSPITKAEVFMHLGEVHEKLGENSKAVQMYERAVQSDANLEQAKERLSALKG